MTKKINLQTKRSTNKNRTTSAKENKMNKMILATALMITTTFSANSQATEKICFYSHGMDNIAYHGDYFTTEISAQKLTVQSAVGAASWDGEFPISKPASVIGHDGNTYLNYYNADGDEGCNTILVNKDLLQAGATGLIKFRCRGEGFDEAVFFCRDSK
jgi:hypothetical protein